MVQSEKKLWKDNKVAKETILASKGKSDLLKVTFDLLGRIQDISCKGMEV